MYIEVQHPIYKSPPAHLSIMEVWDVMQTEISSIGGKSIEILENDDFGNVDLYNMVTWSGFAIQEFQDLLQQPIPKTGRFFNIHYLFFETLSALRECVLCGINGQFQASLAILRSALEMFTFHIWWKERLTGADSFESFYDWLFGLKGSPPFKNVVDSIFDTTSFPSEATTKDQFLSVYTELCGFAHKPLINQAITNLRGTNITIVDEQILSFWLDLLQRTLTIVLDLAIVKSPMALFPLPVYKKFGFSPPLGVFFDDANFLSMKMCLATKRLKSYQSYLQTCEPVPSLLSWFHSLPDQNEHEIMDSWFDDKPLGYEDKPFEDRIFIGYAIVKTKMRAMQRANAYNSSTPEITSVIRSIQTGSSV
jgi:hypothetical protein